MERREEEFNQSVRRGRGERKKEGKRGWEKRERERRRERRGGRWGARAKEGEQGLYLTDNLAHGSIWWQPTSLLSLGAGRHAAFAADQVSVRKGKRREEGRGSR
eukprot:764419-Hanusia_phi.AAC.4